MLLIRSTIIFILLSIVASTGMAQSYRKLIKKGDKLYRKTYFDGAAYYYAKAVEKEGSSAALDYRLGMAYIEGSYKPKAATYLEKVYNEFPDYSPDLEFYLAKAYQFADKYDKALKHFIAFRPHALDKFTVDRSIKQCNISLEYVNNPKDMKIVNVGKGINSDGPDYAPLITADESTMILTSRRAGSTGNKIDQDGYNFEDIYIAKNNNGKWGDLKKIEGGINTPYHESAIGFSPDGKKILIYYSTGNGDIFESNYNGGKWSKPKILSASVSSKYRELSASLTADGKRIYFSSDRPGGYGGLDIYYSELRSNGKWGPAVNCGKKINTAEDEDAPFIHPDGKTLYFSSRGHLGMGGYDIFRCPLTKRGWGMPRNLGYPINTANNEIYFVIAQDNVRGYYATTRSDTYGNSDIYSILMDQRDYVEPVASKQEEVIVDLQPVVDLQIEKYTKAAMIVFSGKVVDAETNEPINARLVLSDNSKNLVVLVKYADPVTGEFNLKIPSDRNYGLTVEKDGYLFSSRSFKAAGLTKDKMMNRTIKLKKADVGMRIVLNNIFFETGKYEVQKESISELDRIYELLKGNKELKIQINGHTDNIGNEKFNKVLSRKRAKSVEQYLLGYGIDPRRLTSKGYGEERPLVSNDNEIGGREINRRTEIEIIGVLH